MFLLEQMKRIKILDFRGKFNLNGKQSVSQIKLKLAIYLAKGGEVVKSNINNENRENYLNTFTSALDGLKSGKQSLCKFL